MEAYKRCRKCNEIKPNYEFHRDSRRRDGRHVYCKTCVKAYTAQYNERNRERINENARQRAKSARTAERVRQLKRQWRERNRDRQLQYQQEWRSKTPKIPKLESQEEIETRRKIWRQRASEYRKNNPDKMREVKQRRRARKSSARVDKISNLMGLLFDIQNGKCLYCDKEFEGKDIHLDHIIPLSFVSLISDYGGHRLSNLALACQRCNSSKSNRILEDWLSWKCPEQMDEILLRVERHIEIMKKEESRGL